MTQQELDKLCHPLLWGMFPDKPVLFARSGYVMLGDSKVEFVTWARKVAITAKARLFLQLVRDLDDWARVAGPGCQLIIREEPTLEEESTSAAMFARMMVVDEDLRPIDPPFKPKPEGADVEALR